MEYWSNQKFIDKLKPWLITGRSRQFLERFEYLTQKINRLDDLSKNTRRRFNTEWILKGAVVNPKVMIIASNYQMSLDFKRKYRKMLKEQNIEPSDEFPIFASLQNYEKHLHGNENFSVVVDLAIL